MEAAELAGWEAALADLCGRIRTAARRAAASGSLGDAARPVHQGAGDVAFGVDVAAEAATTRWFEEVAARGPLSLLTEDHGWRHLGPAPGGGVRALAGFDHGGPRVVLDPIDGSRNLLADLRAAWSAAGLAPPGPAQPRLSDLVLGVLAELPTRRGERPRLVVGVPGRGATLTVAGEDPRPLVADLDDRVDRGYFPFFRYHPAERVALARVEAAFFAALEEREGADLATCWDDQYISNAGQLFLVARGTYRLVCDLRAEVARRRGVATTTAKPYDVAGAVVCARAAGCVVEDAAGRDLDLPLDATTPVSFVGYANQATAARLRGHVRAALVRCQG